MKVGMEQSWGLGMAGEQGGGCLARRVRFWADRCPGSGPGFGPELCCVKPQDSITP